MKAIAFYQVEATKILLRLGPDPNMLNDAIWKNYLLKAYECRNNDIINYVKLYAQKYFDVCSYPQTYVSEASRWAYRVSPRISLHTPTTSVKMGVVSHRYQFLLLK